MIQNIADVQITSRIELNAVRLAHHRISRFATIAGKALLTVACHRRDDFCFCVYAPHRVVEAFDKKQIAAYIVAKTGNPYSGLWYTWVFTAVALVVAWWGLPDGPPRDFSDDAS